MTATRTEPRVVCGIPNTAPGLINGVPFERVEGTDTLVSVGPIEPGTLAIFGAIPGYSVTYVVVPDTTSVTKAAKLDNVSNAPGDVVAVSTAAVAGGSAGAESSIESKTHADGTTVTGKGPLPDQSPDEQAAAAGAGDEDKALGDSTAGAGAGDAVQAAGGAEDAELAAARALLGGDKPAVKTKAAAKTTAKAKAAAAK